ncbi:hypothetical protein FWK35_00009627 [Aphis craccivora]|uniref:Uncharacterized protein n=1 Tax=Aphis craccivora TaxID=307492 RepID=A0A6G0YXG1_APHCR|nr:hypothetical protein FWK35_00009627 [Aphis craccivora]
MVVIQKLITVSS